MLKRRWFKLKRLKPHINMLAFEIGNIMLRGYDLENNIIHEQLNIVGYSQYERALISSEKKQFYFGEQAIENRSFLTLYRPFVNNDIAQASYLTITLKYLIKFKMCLMNLTGRKIMLLVHKLISSKTKNQIKQLLIDSFNATDIQFAPSNQLRLIISPNPNIMLIDVSDSGIEIQCKINNRVDQKHIVSSNQGVRKLAQQLLYKYYSQTEIEQNYENYLLWVQENIYGLSNDLQLNVEQLILDNTDVIQLAKEIMISLPPWSRALMAQNIFVTGGVAKQINVKKFGELIAVKLSEIIVNQNIQCKDALAPAQFMQNLTIV